MTERQKMLAGELYDPLDSELVAAREHARDLCQNLNASRESHQTERRQILTELFGKGGSTVWMQPPFYCDYGSNIELGERVFFNFNCIVLDVASKKFGLPRLEEGRLSLKLSLIDRSLPLRTCI
jgi:maltose O-acetyltransferase